MNKIFFDLIVLGTGSAAPTGAYEVATSLDDSTCRDVGLHSDGAFTWHGSKMLSKIKDYGIRIKLKISNREDTSMVDVLPINWREK